MSATGHIESLRGRTRVLRRVPDFKQSAPVDSSPVSQILELKAPHPKEGTLKRVFERLAPPGSEFSPEALSSVFGMQVSEHGGNLTDLGREHNLASGTVNDVARYLGYETRTPSQAAKEAVRDPLGRFAPLVVLDASPQAAVASNGGQSKNRRQSRIGQISPQQNKVNDNGGEEIVVQARAMVPAKEDALRQLDPLLRMHAVGSEAPEETAHRLVEKFSKDAKAFEIFCSIPMLPDHLIITLFYAVTGYLNLPSESGIEVFVAPAPKVN